MMLNRLNRMLDYFVKDRLVLRQGAMTIESLFRFEKHRIVRRAITVQIHSGTTASPSHKECLYLREL